jgi:hypothetical protein
MNLLTQRSQLTTQPLNIGPHIIITTPNVVIQISHLPLQIVDIPRPRALIAVRHHTPPFFPPDHARQFPRIKKRPQMWGRFSLW